MNKKPIIKPTLQNLSKQHPFDAYHSWWEMGDEWSFFMSDAIIPEWGKLSADSDLDSIKADVNNYIKTIYKRDARKTLVDDFAAKADSIRLQSGEFDALSYSFFKSAFTLLEKRHGDDSPDDCLTKERRQFTQRVGKAFFKQVCDYLGLNVPMQLAGEEDFQQLQVCLRELGAFIQAQGYLRDHFSFTFDLDLQRDGKNILQSQTNFLDKLNSDIAYAVYEMGYPVALPSAVYLYHGLGEAQHHSSRMIEELFALTGHRASETSDFDPVGYPADRVVELWEIGKL